MKLRRKEKIEFVDASVEREEIKGLSFKGIIDGSLLAGNVIGKQLPFIIFLVILAVLYIGNRYHAEKMIRTMNDARSEVKDLRSEQISTAADLMKSSMPSQVQDMVNKGGLGLKQPLKPPYKIEVQD